MSTPPTRYARSGDASIAYQVVGDGPLDLVLVLGFATHLELQWESPALARFFERISSFSRMIVFDKRGTGLSDPVAEVPTLEERIDDVRAVMDAAGSERAALLGISEGGPMSVLFAATHPERVTALVLYGAMGRTTEAPDYPWASPAEALREAAAEFIAPYWGQDAEGTVELFAPSSAHDPETLAWTARMERSAASPAMVQRIFEMFLDIDVRAVLPTIHVPALVLHRRGDRVVSRHAGRELAARIPGARYVELAGIDHVPWAGDAEAVLGEVEEFLTGTRSVPEPDRVLATVMFTDMVGSTQRAVELGDARWRELLSAHQAAVRRELVRFRGREVKTLGDGCPRHLRRPGARDPLRGGDRAGGPRRRPRGPHRPALRRGRADGRGRRRDRRAHRGAHRSPRRRGRGARLQHRQGSRRRGGHPLRGPRREAAEGHLRRVAGVRGSPVMRSANAIARYAGGTNLLAVNTAPWGSLSTVIRTQGASSGGARTFPPSCSARSAIASASSTANVMLQWAGVSVFGHEPRDRVLEALGRLDVGHALAQIGVALGEEVPVAGHPPDAAVARLPAEDRAVERLRALGVARVELAEVPGAGLVDELCPLGLLGLPDAEHRAGRVGEHGHAAGLGDVERPHEHAAARVLHGLGGLVGALDRDVGAPRRHRRPTGRL